ncbi:MAG: cytochrome C oxidase subunit IV family protein [Candidatus Omnitrophica bacterium]|nr:cytochrome C oxidase subunit IV family protein [Candidatus Omnitrophota bacterium]
MTETAHRQPNYLTIFWALLLLTLIEVAIAYLPWPRSVKMTSLISLAIVKALLVALFFMHLKFDRRLLAIIALIPLALTGLVTVFLLVGTSLAAH